MSRQLSLTSFSFAVLAFSTMAVGTANAKECTTSSDCAEGFECVLGVKGGAGTGGSTGSSAGGAGAATGSACVGPDCPVSSTPADLVPPTQAADGGVRIPTPPPDEELIPPVSTAGYCQPKVLVCTSKADCPANLDCVKEIGMVKRPACAPNTTCDTSLPVSETGTCKAVCNVDSDCPAPLTCKVQGQTCMGGGSVGPDGKVTTMPEVCTGGNKVCNYTPVACTTDAECKDANYQCVKEYEYQSCTGSAPTGSCARTKDDAGIVCTPPTTSEPPVCTTTVVKSCQPKEIKCDAGETCPAGWTCLDVSKTDYVSRSGAAVPPSKICAPDGLILVIKGQASGSSGEVYGSTPTRGGSSGIDLGKGGATGQAGNGTVTSNDGTPPPLTAPVPVSDGQEHATPGDAGAEAAATKVRGGGCALGGAQDGALSLWMTLGLAGLVLRLVRRRK